MNTKILKQKILETLILSGNWKMSKIKEISVSIQYGYTGSAIPKGEYKMLRITDIQDDAVNWDTVPFVEIDDVKAHNYLLENDDIVFARTGATVGKSFLIKDLKEKSVFASYLIRIKIKKEFNVQYVKYFFESGFYWQQIQDKAIGTGQPNVNGTLLGELLIPLPPLAVQRQIVSQIETLFAEIDRIEQSRQRLLQTAKLAKQKALAELLNNDEWGSVKLGDVCEYGKCKTVKNSDIPDDAWVLDLEDIEKDTGKLLQRTLKTDKSTTSVRHSFRKGDVLYSKLRTYLNKVLVADMDGFCTTEIIPIDFKGKVIPQFARYVLMSPEFLDYTAQCGYGVKMSRLGTNDAKKAPFPLPPLAVQQQIVSKIESIFAEIERIEKAVKN